MSADSTTNKNDVNVDNSTSDNNEDSESLTIQSPSVSATDIPEIQQAQSGWQEYFQKIVGDVQNDYAKLIIEYAKKDQYEISLRMPTGRKIPDPIDPTQMIDEFKGWTKKDFKRCKITSADYARLEKLRADFNKEKDPTKVADMLARIYQFLAYCYLEMPYEEFIRADWDEVKPILDGCNFRTMYGIPNSQKGSANSANLSQAVKQP
jgi:hypothetical protein